MKPNPTEALMSRDELKHFLETWEIESQKTVKLLDALPTNHYDLRPLQDGRSLGELAWHLCEVEAYPTFGIETGKVDINLKPPGLERPREVRALSSGYARIHGDALRRVRNLKPEDLERRIPYFDGSPMRVGDILWSSLLLHLIHHRGQLVTYTRIAGGTPPGLFGPTREEMAAMMQKK
jgi:uncharacterized damage-inducible protein DinB